MAGCLRVHADIIAVDGQQIAQTTTPTLLGLTFSSALKWEAHIQNLITKANSKRYFLVLLRRSGIATAHLIKLYTIFIRPSVEYAAPAWHPGLSRYLSESFERVQSSCLRAIFPELSYRDSLAASGLQTLRIRREELCKNFARSLFNSNHFSHTPLTSPETSKK